MKEPQIKAIAMLLLQAREVFALPPSLVKYTECAGTAGARRNLRFWRRKKDPARRFQPGPFRFPKHSELVVGKQTSLLCARGQNSSKDFSSHGSLSLCCRLSQKTVQSTSIRTSNIKLCLLSTVPNRVLLQNSSAQEKQSDHGSTFWNDANK